MDWRSYERTEYFLLNIILLTFSDDPEIQNIDPVIIKQQCILCHVAILSCDYTVMWLHCHVTTL